MAGGTMVQGSGWAGQGVRGWGASCPQHSPQPPAAMPGVSTHRQPESIFIPCLKISQSRSLTHDGSSLPRLPPGSFQL